MTISVNPAPHAIDTVRFHITYGQISVDLDEHIGHARSAHRALGEVLDQMEADRDARRAAEQQTTADEQAAIAAGAEATSPDR